MSRVVIVQPYVPAYRTALFDRVVAQLREHGHSARVASQRIDTRRNTRDDATVNAWQSERAGFSVRLGGRHFRSSQSWRSWYRADVVVCELAVGALDTYLALLAPGDRRVIVWGHVGNQTGRSSRLLQRLETWQLKRADGVFAYTAAGRDRAIGQGASPATTVSLENTVDLGRLAAAVEARRTGHESRIWCSSHPVSGKNLVYIGALDAEKRIGFLAGVLDRLWEADPEIRLFVGGAGDQAHLLDASIERGQTELLGRIGDAEKAFLGEIGALLVNPGRVGLLAVESFVLGLPIVTTDWRFHAPEFEYLTPGSDCVVTPDDVDSFAGAVIDLLDPDDGRLRALTTHALGKAGWPSLEHMAARFVSGCLVQVESLRPR